MEYCKVTQGSNGISFEAAGFTDTDINKVVENDKKYGIMSPRNGIYFTFRVSNTHDDELTDKEMIRAVTLAWQHWSKRIDFPVKKAKVGEHADFRVIFRTVETDERHVMEDNTIMYHYFPINDTSNDKRGLCVVNSGFYYTVHGKKVSMHKIDPDNYDSDTNTEGRTIDIDQVLTHEFGHGIGLPHDGVPHNVMSPNYGIMAEFPTERDVFRGLKKYGIPKMSKSWFSRWFKYLRHRSDNY